MPNRTSSEVLDREYLELRSFILQLAASWDRVERAEGTADERTEKLEAGLRILLDDQSDKARRVQELFSQDYNASWRTEFGI